MRPISEELTAQLLDDLVFLHALAVADHVGGPSDEAVDSASEFERARPNARVSNSLGASRHDLPAGGLQSAHGALGVEPSADDDSEFAVTAPPGAVPLAAVCERCTN